MGCHRLTCPATASSTFTTFSRTGGVGGWNSRKPRTIPSCHLHTQPSFCHVSCFRRRWAPSPARKPLLCCDTTREMCHGAADRKWMVSKTHRQLTSTEDSSKCGGGGAVAAAAWRQPVGCDTALLAEGSDASAGSDHVSVGNGHESPEEKQNTENIPSRWTHFVAK